MANLNQQADANGNPIPPNQDQRAYIPVGRGAPREKTLEELEHEIASNFSINAQARQRQLTRLRADFYSNRRKFDNAKTKLVRKAENQIINTIKPRYKVARLDAPSPHPHLENLEVQEIYLPDDNQDQNPVAIFANMNAVRGSNNTKQICAHVVGILVSLLPGLRPKIMQDLERHGFEFNIIKLPSEAAANLLMIDLLPTYDSQTLMAVFAMCIILIFKQVNNNNFDKVYASRCAALRNHLGVPPDVQIPKIFTVAKAQAVRTVLGSATELRRDLLMYLLDSMSGRHSENAMARYVAGILEWNEMNNFLFVYEAMILSNSPVLSDVRLHNESLAYYDLICTVSKFQYPQYFRYFCSEEQVALLDRSKFPVLSAVAVKIKRELMGATTLQNFVTTNFQDKKLTDELFISHSIFLQDSQPATMTRILKHLYAPPDSYADQDQGRLMLEEIDED